MSKIKTHTFCGKKYHIELGPVEALCDVSKNIILEIVFAKKLNKSKDSFDTIIHESLHVCFPNATEEHIKRAANDITRFLWRLGYRKKS